MDKVRTEERMHRLVRHLGVALLLAGCLAQRARAQKAFTWQEVRDKFETTNPTLQAGKLNISESRAQEITAFLRPNPDLTMTLDQFDPFSPNPYRPFALRAAVRLRQLFARAPA